MKETTVKLGDAGRLVIPARYRKELGVSEGDRLVIRMTEGRLEIMTPQQAVETARGIIRKYIPKGRKLSEELIAERRKEAARE